MKEVFEIKGKKPLRGEVEVKGAKNAAGPALAATLLTDKDCFIGNLPKTTDVLNFLDILKSLGKGVEWVGDDEVRIFIENPLNPDRMDFDKISKSRISVLLIGALINRLDSFKISAPGGDRIGLRPIATHIVALREMGADIVRDGDFYYIKRSHLSPSQIVLPEFSVTATENLMMASSLLEGKTVIKGVAIEPHVQDLAAILNKMGARVTFGIDHSIKIEGRKKLQGIKHRIIPDTNEAGTFLIIGSLLGEPLKIKNVIFGHLDVFFRKLTEIGVKFKKENNSVEVCRSDNLKAARIQALPYPGFPTDLLPIVVPLLTQSEGRSLLHDPLYENRLNYIHELRKMGADIEIVDPHRAFVFGKTPLKGVKIESWDIRAGAALIVAGLIAEGKTTIENIYQIDRGYEQIEKRLQQLGAEIERKVV